VDEARATILALGVACTATAVLRRSHAAGFLRMMAFSALAGAAIYLLAFILLPILLGMPSVGAPLNVLQRTAADPSSGRTLLWKLALELIRAHPWLGIGPQHFAHDGVKLYIGAHPHDWLLQVGVEWGVPALLCLLGVFALGARALVRSSAQIAAADVPGQQMLTVFLVACSAICVDGLFSGVLVMPQSQLAIALVAGCASGWVRSLDGGTARPSAPAPVRHAGMVLAAVALCGLVWSLTPDIVRHARGEPLTPAEQAANAGTHWPRLWEAGYF
jgi:putative inorganic carbon (HCO3(-)) transporter